MTDINVSISSPLTISANAQISGSMVGVNVQTLQPSILVSISSGLNIASGTYVQRAGDTMTGALVINGIASGTGQLVINGPAGQVSEPIFQVKYNGAPIFGVLGPSGSMAIGARPSDEIGLIVRKIFKSGSIANAAMSILGSLDSNASAPVSQSMSYITGFIRGSGTGGAGVPFIVQSIDLQNQQVTGSWSSLQGITTSIRVTAGSAVTNGYGYRNIFIIPGSAGITNAFDFDARASSLSGLGQITNHYGFHVENLGNAKQTNSYGVYVENQTGSLTNSHALYTNLGLIHFGDNVDLTSGKTLTMPAGSIISDTTTGLKVGTVGGAAGQKLGFFNATPVVQPVLASGTGKTVDNVIAALQSLGLVRQS